MNRYPLWKNLLVVIVMVLGLLVSLPNVFGEDPAIQVSREKGSGFSTGEVQEIQRKLDGLNLGYTELYRDEGRAVARFRTVDDQLKASDRFKETLGPGYVIALTWGDGRVLTIRDYRYVPYIAQEGDFQFVG